MGIEDLIQTKSFNLEVCTLIEGLVFVDVELFLL